MQLDLPVRAPGLRPTANSPGSGLQRCSQEGLLARDGNCASGVAAAGWEGRGGGSLRQQASLQFSFDVAAQSTGCRSTVLLAAGCTFHQPGMLSTWLSVPDYSPPKGVLSKVVLHKQRGNGGNEKMQKKKGETWSNFWFFFRRVAARAWSALMHAQERVEGRLMGGGEGGICLSLWLEGAGTTHTQYGSRCKWGKRCLATRDGGGKQASRGK